MGTCCCYCCCWRRRKRKKEKSPLLSESRRQKQALERAISLENPQRTLEINIDEIHSHNSLPLSFGNNKHNQSLNQYNHSLNHLNEQRVISNSLETIENHYKSNKKNDNESITFYPSSISPLFVNKQILSRKRFIDSNQLKYFCKELNCTEKHIETSFDENCEIIDYVEYDKLSKKCIHPFIHCVEMAYFEHYPLKLSPSNIWILILQSVAIKYNEDIDDINIVNIKLYETDSMLTEIDKNISNNDIKLLLENDYTDSSKLHEVASKLCMIGNIENIEYIEENKDMKDGEDGFVSITLNGTKKDWISLKTKTINLLKSDYVEKEYSNKWSKSLLPFLDKFINAYDGNIDSMFWNDNKWINIFNNKYIGLCSIKIDKEKQFLSGFIGINQNKQTLEIEPIVGWFIVNHNDK